MVTGRSGVNIERPCHSCQWGDVTFGGSPPHSVLETLRLRSGRTEFPSPGDGFRLGRYRLGGGCAFRRDGFLPPQERRMEGGGEVRNSVMWRVPDSRLRRIFELAGFRDGRAIAVWRGEMRRVGKVRAAPARPFDSAQDERPHAKEGFRLRGRNDGVIDPECDFARTRPVLSGMAGRTL